MSLFALQTLELPKALRATRDSLFNALEKKQILTAREALYKLLKHLMKPSGVLYAIKMFEQRSVEPQLSPSLLRSLACALNILPHETKVLLFSAKFKQINENQLQQFFKLSEFATAIREYQFESLQRSRESKGFVHFLADLKDPKYNTEREHWSLTRGLLVVDYAKATDPAVIADIHEFIGQPHVLGGKPWFEKPTSDHALNQYGIKFKTLGKRVNAAVDPIFILRKTDGSLSVLCGKRFDGTHAFPGGMNESTVVDTCINELLEECFSGNLFSSGSITEGLINQKVDIDEKVAVAIQRTYIAQFQTIKEPQSGTPGYVKQMAAFKDEQAALKTQITQIIPVKASAQTISNYIQTIVAAIRGSAIEKGKIEPLVAHIKCDLYKQFLPEQFNHFDTFVKAKMHKEPLVLNQSDPRNTDLGAMYTNPLEAILDEDELTKVLTSECGLEFGAGDDLGDVKYRPIEDFAVNAYSDHASLLIQAINRGVLRQDIALTPSINQQLSTIAETLELEAPIMPEAHQATRGLCN